MENKQAAVIGLGYVGLPLAVALSKKHSVIGYDINRKRIKSLKKFEDETGEITSSQLKNCKNIKFTNSKNHLKNCNTFIITVPTPINNSKTPDLSPLNSASTFVANN